MANDNLQFRIERKRLPAARWIFLFILFSAPVSAPAQNRVVGYYPGWIKSKLPANRILFQHLTHINHAFAWPNSNGTISNYTEVNHPELINATHQAGKKILISLGGWGQSDGFAPVAADTSIRKTFIQNLIAFCTSRGYDGADFDWEFPATNADRANLTALIKETREAFDQVTPSLLLTMVAVAGDWNGKWHDYAKLAEYVDWFNLMAYDFHGNWEPHHAGHNAPLYAPPTDHEGSGHQGVQYLTGARGIPKAKIHLGMPFYGKEFNASQLYGPCTGGADLEYSAIALRLNAGWTRYWDDVSKVPYLKNSTNTKLMTYDDSLSVSTKCQYAKQNGLGGVMIWALGHDVIGNTQPLLQAVGLAMSTSTEVSENRLPIARSFELFNNYPNPFNASTTISFNLKKDATVNLSIYNVIGELVAVLANSKMTQGPHKITWDATDQSSAIYFYQLEAEGFKDTKRMILAK